MRVARIATPTGARFAVARPGDDEWAVVEDPFADTLVFTGYTAPLEGTPLLAPVDPRVLVGIAHNKTNNDHRLPIQAWHKSVRSVAAPDTEVPIRTDIGQVNIEGELAVVIGRRAHRLTLDNALDAVFGYTVGNDVTHVDQVAVDERFFQVKSGLAHAPLGPWIETVVADPDNVEIVVSINGFVEATSTTANLPSTVAECLVYVTAWLELGPGDVVLTGAPRTFLPTAAGDVVAISLPPIGTLTNTIVSEAPHD
jgi:2-keto-4-pentenoate hydratase/2-oxohepta-3-ene-1,7-dioic acid hydratase in catechol pathway